MVSRNCLGAAGKQTTMKIPSPIVTEQYHLFVGGYASLNPKQLVSRAKDWAVMLQIEYVLACE